MRQKQFVSCCLLVLTFLFLSNDSKSQGTPFAEDSVLIVSGGYKIAGTISYPTQPKKAPAIIMIWGSGPHTRDQVVSKTPMFKQMAAYFNQQGFAVMRIDKRGFGRSEGPRGKSESVTTSAQLADDVYASLQVLKSNKRIDPSRIGLLGHSEGAWIAEMVALKDTTVQWLALLGAHTVNGADVQLDQMTSNLKRLGATPEVVENVRPQIKRLTDFVKKDYSNDSVYYAIGTDFLKAHGVADSAITHKFIDQFIDAFRSPWNQYFFSHNPSDHIRQLKMPVLFVYGDRDRNVSAALNLPALVTTIRESGNSNMKVSVLSDHDHFFLHYQNRSLDKHKPGEMEVSSKLLQEISSWIKGL